MCCSKNMTAKALSIKLERTHCNVGIENIITTKVLEPVVQSWVDPGFQGIQAYEQDLRFIRISS